VDNCSTTYSVQSVRTPKITEQQKSLAYFNISICRKSLDLV